MDWIDWHSDYDEDSPLRRRLEIVQTWIRTALTEEKRSPVRVISLCSGEARDLLGALETVARRDVTGRLVELDPELAVRARRHAADLGLAQLEVVVGDAGTTAAFRGATPADLVLACGVLGNMSDADVERTVRALPMLSAPGSTLIWTRHRRPPDLTQSIRHWLADSGFEEIAYVPVPDSLATVGVARYAGGTVPFAEQALFTFNRTERRP